MRTDEEQAPTTLSKHHYDLYLKSKKKFDSQGRKDVCLCIEGFKTHKEKAKFHDLVVNDFFWSRPQDVLKHNIVHPKRRLTKKKQTCLKKFGTEHALQSEEIKKKIKETNIKNHGAANPSQSAAVKEKKKQTCLKNWGTEYSLSSPEILKKKKQTCLKNWGVDHPSKSQIIKDKKRTTSLKNYGEVHPTKSMLFKQQHYNRIVLETGEHLKDWLAKQPEPKPGYSSMQVSFPNKEISILELTSYLEAYKNSKTKLEHFFESNYLQKHYNKKTPTKKLYRPDFKLSDNIFVNVDGLYWHSEHKKHKKYHFDIRNDFEEHGLRLFQFREDEIYQKFDVVKSIINNSLNKTENMLFARKCKIKKIVDSSEAKNFLSNNHLMGYLPAKHVGLYFDGTLVSLMSYKVKSQILKIERFCTKKNFGVIGGFSKLVKHVKSIYRPNIKSIHNWVDLRYGTGTHLLNKGFVVVKDVLSWKWTDGKSTFNRLRCYANMDDRKLSQKQHAKELGWYKIYDAGQRLYVKLL